MVGCDEWVGRDRMHAVASGGMSWCGQVFVGHCSHVPALVPSFLMQCNAEHRFGLGCINQEFRLLNQHGAICDGVLWRGVVWCGMG